MIGCDDARARVDRARCRAQPQHATGASRPGVRTPSEPRLASRAARRANTSRRRPSRWSKCSPDAAPASRRRQRAAASTRCVGRTTRPGIVHRAEVHEEEVVRRVGIRVAGGAALVAVGERRLVAMVAVGDEHLRRRAAPSTMRCRSSRHRRCARRDGARRRRSTSIHGAARCRRRARRRRAPRARCGYTPKIGAQVGAAGVSSASAGRPWRSGTCARAAGCCRR